MQSVSLSKLTRLFQKHGSDFPSLLRNEYGDAVRARLYILPDMVLLFHPEDIHQVLVRQAQHVEKPNLARRMLVSSFGDGLFTSEGPKWRRQRKLMQPTFHHARIGRFAERMVQHTGKMLETWHHGEERVIDADMHALTFTIVVDALFSKVATDSTCDVAAAVHALGKGLEEQGNSLALTLMPEWVPHPALRQKQRGVRALDRLVYEMIEHRRALGEASSPHDLLTMLLFACDADTGEQMDERQVRDELVTLFIAGHETTAVLLGWTWSLLAQHPDVEAKLHAEVDAVLGGRPPALDDLPRLPYVEAVIKESLRLSPPAWFLFRQNDTPLELNAGGTIPENNMIMLFPYTTQRDARWFESPSAFRPERWQGDLERALPKGAYFPFGMGPRVGIGNGFASMEAALIVAAIAQRYKLEFIDMPQPTKGVTTLAFAEPVRVRLHAR